MFKIGSFENEIFESMQKNLISQQAEKMHGFNKLAQAADLLNAAASIFDKAGLTEEAIELTNLIQELSKEISK